MFLKSLSLSAAAVTAAALVGCKETSSSASSSSSSAGSVSSLAASESNSTAESASSSEPLSDPVETEYWTLEECKEEGGLFYKTEDSFFLPYNNFDCVRDIGDYARTVEAYIDTYDAAVTNPLDSLCFFMWPEYKSSTFAAYVYKIIATGWMPSIIFPGDTSYRMVTSLYPSESNQQVHFFSEYSLTNYRDLWVQTVDGEEAYQSKDIVTLIDYGYGNKVNAFSDDAKGKWLTLGYAEGTTLTEQDCQLCLFFGICSNLSEDYVSVDVTPTRDGYAILDFSSAEEGLYVLGLSVKDAKTKHTLLSVKH